MEKKGQRIINPSLFTIETILTTAVLVNVNNDKTADDSWDIKIIFDPSTMPQVLKEFPSLAMYDLETEFLNEKGLPIADKKAFAINEIRVEGNVMFILFSIRIIINGKTLAPPRKSEIEVDYGIIFYFKKKMIRMLKISQDLK